MKKEIVILDRIDGFTTFGNVYDDIDDCINKQSNSIMGYTS